MAGFPGRDWRLFKNGVEAVAAIGPKTAYLRQAITLLGPFIEFSLVLGIAQIVTGNPCLSLG